MPKRHDNLFQQIVSDSNLWSAYDLTRRGKRNSAGYLCFKEDAPARLAEIKNALISGSYTPQPYRTFFVTEPKPRQIDALCFADRVVQHALHNVLEPVFDVMFYPRSYACRKGGGTHRGARNVQAEMRRMLKKCDDVYFLKTDWKKYFHSIDLSRLWLSIQKKINCQQTLSLVEKFTPKTGRGLPIGNLTSQLWANVYGHIADSWIVQRGERCWHRYMDDIVVLGGGKEGLHRLIAMQRDFAKFCQEEMNLDLSKWSVSRHCRGINFLGYRIWPTHKLLRKSSVNRARRTCKKLRKGNDSHAWDAWLGAWSGHAKFANTHNLRTSMGLEPATT